MEIISWHLFAVCNPWIMFRKKNLTRLHLVKNTFARVVAQKPRCCLITPVLLICIGLRFAELVLKLLHTITFRVLQFQQPSFLASFIPKYVLTRAFRSSSSLSPCVPPRKTTMISIESFLSDASNTWNALPGHLPFIPTLPAFRRALKHHPFLLVYSDSSVKSGMIKPAQWITLRDTAPTSAIAQPGKPCRPFEGVPSERLRLVNLNPLTWGQIDPRRPHHGCQTCIFYCHVSCFRYSFWGHLGYMNTKFHNISKNGYGMGVSQTFYTLIG